MKPIENLRDFYQSTLIGRLQELENKRKALVKRIIPTICIVSPCIIFLLFLGFKAAIFLFPVIFALIYFFRFLGPIKEYTSEFKSQIIARIVTFIDENLQYESQKYISSSLFRGSDIFKVAPDRYCGDDFVSGKIKDTSFQFSEIHAEYKTETTDSKGRRQEHWHTIFKGIFFIGDFNKRFKGKTVVLPDNLEKLFGNMGSVMQGWNLMRSQLVKLDDPEFEKLFVVYSDDQIEARYILSMSLMKRIVDFKNKTKKQIYLSFVGNKIFVAVPYTRNLFEPSIFKTVLDFNPIQQYCEDLQLAVGIIDELNLNTRIWQ